MINRRLRAFGLAPALAYPLCLLVFVGCSLFLFYKTTYANYIYPLMALSFLGNLSKQGRNEFLRYCFPVKHYQQVRLFENLLVALPFVLFLLFKSALLEAIALSLIAALLSFFKARNVGNYGLPTPFYRYPFEFAVGFRKNFLFLLGVYFVAIMGFWVDNFNLSIFTLVIVFAVAITFYTTPEAPFYVWVFAQKRRQFLLGKIKVAILYANLMAFPLVVTILLLYPTFWWVVLLALLFGSLFLVAVILAKYADFPREIGLPSAIFLAVSIPLTPLLLLLVPYFFKKAMQRLKPILV